MKQTNHILALGLLLFIYSSCKKTDPVSTPTTSSYGTYSSMDAVYSLLEVKPSYFTVNATTGGTFTGASGTKYKVPANCLQDASGVSVTGNVQFAASEYLKKGDMIFSKMLPVSNNEPLMSGGEINVTASVGGQTIYLKPGCQLSATFPRDKDSTGSMQLFRGDTVKAQGVNVVNWRNRVDSGHIGGGIVYNGDTITILPDSLGMCNADRFLFSPNYQTFTVTISVSGGASLGTTSMTGMALYDNYKGVWPMSGYSNGVFSESHVPDVPVHFAVYGLINNRFYAGISPATPANGKNYLVTLFETDPTTFKSQLNNLTK